jgi:putative transposase
VKFAFIAKHRGIGPAGWLCEALGVSRAGFYAWRTRPPSDRARADEQFLIHVRASFLSSDGTYGARRVWHDVLVEGLTCGLHRIERLMRHAALRARPRRRRMPSDTGVRFDARARAECTQSDVRRRLGEPQMGRRLHLSLDR